MGVEDERKVESAFTKENGGGVHWYVLACFRRMRQRGARRRFSECRYRSAGRVPRVRVDGADDGVCDWPHIGLPPESSSFCWVGGREAVSRQGVVKLHCRADCGRLSRGGGPVPDRQWQVWF